MSSNPNVKWDDVAGLDEAKDQLIDSCILPFKFPEIFTGKRKPPKGILLYGPPGTGKSYLAKAVATESKSTFFNIKCSTIMSKYQGESEKMISFLFERARKNSPSIIFIDEVDSFASERNDKDQSSIIRVKNELLQQMDGVGDENKGILVLGATNLPWNIDTAFIRRFQRKIHVGLPDLKARQKMFKIHIGNTPNALQSNNDNNDFKELAELTKGYSGDDISNLVSAALMIPIQTCKLSCFFKKVSGINPKNTESGEILHDLWTPCSPGDKQGVEMSLNDIQSGKLLVPLLKKNDFLKALKSIKPSVNPKSLNQYKTFTNQFGMEGGL